LNENGRTRTAMWTDCIEQLRGTAGPRQVRVRAEVALAGFGPPRGRLAHVQQISQLETSRGTGPTSWLDGRGDWLTGHRHVPHEHVGPRAPNDRPRHRETYARDAARVARRVLPGKGARNGAMHTIDHRGCGCPSSVPGALPG
jgi:hypothetical protein